VVVCLLAQRLAVARPDAPSLVYRSGIADPRESEH
jgi:hypothetical protein